MIQDSPIVRQKHEERCYCVHFIAHSNFDLSSFLELLNERYPLRVLREQNGICTIVVRICPVHLRLLVEILPKHLAVSYEATEPGTC